MTGWVKVADHVGFRLSQRSWIQPNNREKLNIERNPTFSTAQYALFFMRITFPDLLAVFDESKKF
jgi:hypothetical protein